MAEKALLYEMRAATTPRAAAFRIESKSFCPLFVSTHKHTHMGV